MAIRSVADITSALNNGRFWWGYLRRGGPAMTANIWADLSYAAGIPVANYYASTPLTSAILDGRSGIDIGPNPATGMNKYVKRVMILPPTATGVLQFEFIDILLYYPFVDGDGGYQDMVNNVSIPRYNGHGCKIMVVSQGVGTNNANVRVTYTNSDGVSGKQVMATLQLGAAAGSLCSSFAPGTAITYPEGPFLPLCLGCKGVRSIENVEYLNPGGGIASFVIVRPLLGATMFEATSAPVEVDTLADRTFNMPRLENGAYLSAISRGTTTQSPATITAQIETIWG